MNTPSDDSLLEQYLRGESRLSRSYRAAREQHAEAPQPIDAAILAAAHRAVSARPVAAARQPGNVWRRYGVPLAAAATVVAAAALTWLLQREPPLQVAGVERPQPATVPAPPIEEAAAPSDQSTAPAEPDAALIVRQEPTLAKSVRIETEARAQSGASPAPRSAPAQVTPAARPAAPAAPQPRSASEQEAERAAADVVIAAAPHQAVPPASNEELARAAPQDATQELHDAAGAASAAEQAEHLAQEAKTESSAVKPLEGSANADSAAPAEKQVLAQEGVGGEPPAPAVAAAEPQAAAVAGAGPPPTASAQPGALAGASGASGGIARAPREPKLWLEQIRTMQRQGATQAARRQLQQFRKQYPDYKLPPELAELMSTNP